MRGAFSYDGLDRALHERARLSILTALSSSEQARAFSDLKSLCDLTDGNLSRHLKVLAEAKLVRTTKRGQGRSAETLVSMTAAGRRTFTAYLDELERVLRDARGTAAPARPADSPHGDEGSASSAAGPAPA